MKRLFIFITIILLLGLVVFYFYQKNGGVKEIEFVKLERLKFDKIIPFPKLTLVSSANVVLDNPNLFGVTITAMDFDVYVEGKHTTTVRQDISMEMPAQTQFKLPVNFDIPLGKSGFFKDAKDVLTGAWKNQSLKIKTIGTIYIEAVKLDFEIPFDEEEIYLLKDYLPK